MLNVLFHASGSLCHEEAEVQRVGGSFVHLDDVLFACSPGVSSAFSSLVAMADRCRFGCAAAAAAAPGAKRGCCTSRAIGGGGGAPGGGASGDRPNANMEDECCDVPPPPPNRLLRAGESVCGNDRNTSGAALAAPLCSHVSDSAVERSAFFDACGASLSAARHLCRCGPDFGVGQRGDHAPLPRDALLELPVEDDDEEGALSAILPRPEHVAELPAPLSSD